MFGFTSLNLSDRTHPAGRAGSYLLPVTLKLCSEHVNHFETQEVKSFASEERSGGFQKLVSTGGASFARGEPHQGKPGKCVRLRLGLDPIRMVESTGRCRIGGNAHRSRRIEFNALWHRIISDQKINA
jgi:hypothetical protein